MKHLRESLRLYAVTDRRWLRGSLQDAVRDAVKGGATAVEYREKNLRGEEAYQEARSVQNVCREFGVPFIVDDDVDMALSLDADGVHLGQGDMDAETARKILGPEKILGISARTVKDAQKAEAAFADYLGVGAVFATGTKNDAQNISIELLKEIAGSVSVPVVAIGGINAGNIMGLKGSGIVGVAVVSGIFAQENIETATKDLRILADEIV